MGDFSHLMNKKGVMIAKPLPQPTLPNLSVDDDDASAVSTTKRSLPGAYAHDYYYGSDSKSIAPSYHTNTAGVDYSECPPMPAYGGAYNHAYASSFEDGSPYHGTNDDDYGSAINLPVAAAPTAYRHDVYDVYGTAASGGSYPTGPREGYQDTATPGIRPLSDSEMARDVQDYPSHYHGQAYTHDNAHYGGPHRQYQGERDLYEYGHAL